MEQNPSKSRTGISGLDAVLNGGYPNNRATLLVGGPGCGKSLVGHTFIGYGAAECDEPGVILSFEELPHEIIQNSHFLGFEMQNLVDKNLIFIDFVETDGSIAPGADSFGLGGLFARLEYAINKVKAKRIFIDSVESMFAQFESHASIKVDLKRLLQWLKKKGLTILLTGEKGSHQLTKLGLEEYASDCVLVLDHRVENQLSTRRLRVIKCRGSGHATDEFPFLIRSKVGVQVMPVTSLMLNYEAKEERLATGNAGLDRLLDGGFYVGSTCLVDGSAGCGKTTVAAQFAQHQAAKNGKQVLFVAFEESGSQITRNMHSVNIDLAPWLERKKICFHALRPSFYGLETHLSNLEEVIFEQKPDIVIIDPISSLLSMGNKSQVYSILIRLLDTLKEKGATVMMTTLKSHDIKEDYGGTGISSIVDSWVDLSYEVQGNKRNRTISIIKARGIANSNLICPFEITSNGLEIQL